MTTTISKLKYAYHLTMLLQTDIFGLKYALNTIVSEVLLINVTSAVYVDDLPGDV
jgi:hypothetical protein